jgi:hypothetical protein
LMLRSKVVWILFFIRDSCVYLYLSILVLFQCDPEFKAAFEFTFS